MRKSPFRLAISQSFISASITENAKTIIGDIERAAASGARLIHFPEGALSGYAKAQISSWDDYPFDGLENQLDEICIAARKFGVWAVFGCASRIDSRRNPYNSLVVVSDTGKVINRYDKRFCSHSEISGYYSAGTKPVVVEIDGYKFGCALCIEIQFPEIFLEYETLNVDCVLFSSYSETPMFGIQAKGHAACNNYWISFAVPAQCSEQMQSCLIGPTGDVIMKAGNAGKEDIVIAEIDRNDSAFDVALTKARPWRRLARQGDIYKK